MSQVRVLVLFAVSVTALFPLCQAVLPAAPHCVSTSLTAGLVLAAVLEAAFGRMAVRR